MGELVLQPTGIMHPSIRQRIRSRLAATIATILCIAFLIITALSVWQSKRAKLIEAERLVTTAAALSHALDIEVSGALAFLSGVASARSLRADNLQEFYDQLKAAPVPDDSWLLLSDSQGLILSTLRPFGTIGPPILADFNRDPNDLARFKQRGFSVTGFRNSVIAPTVAIAVNLKIERPNVAFKYILTTVIPEKRIKKLLVKQHASLGILSAIYDRNMKGIVAFRGDIISPNPPIPSGLSDHLTGHFGSDERGLIHTVDNHGVPVVVAYARSIFTDWTATAEIPLAQLDHSFYEMLWQLAASGIVLMMIGAFTYGFMTREVEAPIDLLQTSIIEAREALNLSNQKLANSEEDVQRRMALELHDSTAQHLVGALLGLMSIGPKVSSNHTDLVAMADIKQSIEQALGELRTFSFLLHPPDLISRGLALTLEDFVYGFARRTKLQGKAIIDPHVDAIPFEMQRAFLRIAQEALINTHRHADASRVFVSLEITEALASLTITDDGSGIGLSSSGSPTLRSPQGVGILGMRDRLLPFNGRLEIKTSGCGTTIRATVPIESVLQGRDEL